MTTSKKVIGMIAVALVYFIFDSLLQAGFFYTIAHVGFNDTELIRGVFGPEDMEWDRENNVIYVSSTNRRSMYLNTFDKEDGIFVLNPITSEIIRLRVQFDGEFHPLGISLFTQEGKQYLYAVNRSPKSKSVELFEVLDSVLIHKHTYINDLLYSPNDVVGDEVGKFYVTNDHGNRSVNGQLVENYLRMPYSYVVYYNGVKYKKVLQGLVYANGIQMSNNGKKLYVTHTVGHELIVLDRDLKTGNLREQKKVTIPSGLDNIDVDLEGNIWIAAHPKLLKFGSHKASSESYSPSQVFKVEVTDKKYEVHKMYENKGEQISGSSVAVSDGSHVFIGCVFDDKILKVKI